MWIPPFFPRRNKREDVPLCFFCCTDVILKTAPMNALGDRECKERIYYEIHVSSILDIIYRKLYQNYKILKVWWILQRVEITFWDEMPRSHLKSTYVGIFYVGRRGQTFSVFLLGLQTMIDKFPLCKEICIRLLPVQKQDFRERCAIRLQLSSH